MSTERIDPFADLGELPSFTTKPRTHKPVDTKAIDQIARDQNFPSRQPAKEQAVPEPRKRRVYTTGRNRQINFKGTAETIERFYSMADSRGVKLCELLEQALDALDRQT